MRWIQDMSPVMAFVLDVFSNDSVLEQLLYFFAKLECCEFMLRNLSSKSAVQFGLEENAEVPRGVVVCVAIAKGCDAFMSLLVYRKKELAQVSSFDSCAVGSVGHKGQQSGVRVVAVGREE